MVRPDNEAVSLRIDVNESVAADSRDRADSDTDAILVLACDAAELAEAISELAPERAVLALEAADERSEEAAAALVERADSALLRTEAALVGLGMGMGRMVMSLDFRSEAREVAAEEAADTAEVALESSSDALDVMEEPIAECSAWGFVRILGLLVCGDCEKLPNANELDRALRLVTALALSPEMVTAGIMTGVKAGIVASVGMDAEAGMTMEVVYPLMVKGMIAPGVSDRIC